VNRCGERLYNGLIKENPTFVLMLGMCPTLAVTTSAINGLGMGLSTTAVLIMSNMIISLLRKVIPDKVRMPAYIVIVASFVTIIQLLLAGFVPSLYDSLGIYIPLIVVNCIILGRAESYASKNPVLPSIFDGIGMGLGFTVGLTFIGLFREVLGSFKAFDFTLFKTTDTSVIQPINIFVVAPGAFFVLAILTALQNKLKAPSATNVPHKPIACGGNCSSCNGIECVANRQIIDEQKEKEKQEKLAIAKEKAAKAKAAKEAAAKEKAEKEVIKEDKEDKKENKEANNNETNEEQTKKDE